MSEMVERVAKAIWDSRTAGTDARRYNYDWEHVAAEIRRSNIQHARAAIKAMMEPTEAMTAAAIRAESGLVPIYQAMLTAALEESKE